MKKLFTKENLVNLSLILYILSILLDLHIFYNPVSTIIRVLFISIIFLIIYFKFGNKKDRRILLSYFILLFIYIILHLFSTSEFNIGFNITYNMYEELLYFLKMSMHILIIYSIYKLSISKEKFYKAIEISTLLIVLNIIICNIFKIGYTSYDFNSISYNIFDWFTKDINFLEASSKGYFHLTNQISAILILDMSIMLICIKEKQKIINTTTLFLTIIALFMLGTRISTYSIFIILGVSLIVYILTGIKDRSIKKSFVLTHIILLLISLILYFKCPLISRNEFYSEKYKESEKKTEDVDLEDNIELNDEEFKDLLKDFNIDPKFYNEYYPLEQDREFYENFIENDLSKVSNVRFLEKSIIERIKSLNDNKYDNLFGIGYSRMMNVFNIESDFVAQYYSIGVLGSIIILGVYILLLLYSYFKSLFNLKKHFNYINCMFLFILTYFLITAYCTGNILNSISCIIPYSFILGYYLSLLNKKEKTEYEYILGFKTSTKNEKEILKEIFKSEEQVILYNINPLIIMNFYKNKKAVKEFNKQNLNIPDGNGIILTSKLTSGCLTNTIPGVELFESICKESVKHKYKIYLYGAKQNSVYNTKVGLESKYKGIKIVGYKNGYTKEKEVLEDILKKKPDILFVALGSPKQENFIIKNKSKLKKIKIIMPVGGTFDVISKNTKRAPLIIRDLKLEWLYRMIKEPKLFKNFGKYIKYFFTVLFFNNHYNKKVISKEKKVVKEKSYKLRKVLGYLCVALPLLILLSVLWANKTFGNPDIDEILFTMTNSLNGTDMNIILSYCLYALLPVILFTIIYIILLKITKRNEKFNKIYLIIILFGIVMCGFTSLYVERRFSIKEYVSSNRTSTEFIEKNYVATDLDNIKFPEDKNNLIVIYLESMEMTFSSKENGGSYDFNYIPNLTKLAQENINFSNSEFLGGANSISSLSWTTAGLIATTSGLPIKTSFRNANDQIFVFPNINALGNVMQENGYNMEFMLGSDASFGGMENYLLAHGNYKIFDLRYAKENNLLKDIKLTSWGISDRDLFELSKKELVNLSNQDKPFYFSLMTIDTHAPEGTSYKDCKSVSEDKYFNSIYCADITINSFINWLKEQDFYENTTIVLTGDHLSMSSLVEVDNRSIYNVIINSKVEPENDKNRLFTNLDMYPTILASLGVEIEENQLGLGVNLFSNKKTLAEKYTFVEFVTQMSYYSRFYNDELLN